MNAKVVRANLLLDGGTGEGRFFRGHEDHLVATGGGEHHALTFQAAQFGGGQVGDDDDLLADKLFRCVVVSDAGADLPLLGAEIDMQHQQFVGIGMGLSGGDRRNLELDLFKIVDGDFFRRGFRFHAVEISEVARQKKLRSCGAEIP